MRRHDGGMMITFARACTHVLSPRARPGVCFCLLRFSACATGRYETYYEAVDPDNSGSLAQASGTCVSQANIAANAARASESASQTSGGGFWGGFANGMSVNLAEQNAINCLQKFLGKRQVLQEVWGDLCIL